MNEGPISAGRKPWRLLFIMTGLAVVFLPPLAGILMLVLQVLGDSSYDLSRLALTDYPRAAFALLTAGTLVGYLYGVVPALLSAAFLGWVVLSGRRLTFGWIALAILGGGVAGFGVMSLLIGGITSLTLMATTLLAASLLWFTFKPYVRVYLTAARTAGDE
ncbi:MAG: hypothetical protein JJ908_14570 [Rhizobiales bacterium]|nr:hypothetical protein [Hyphomicrobiales bacterium]MBO6700244.1 hypothetical protein [Hyphomicrobiales bacterium]MBO6737591.1 hypothetical protein [Hyphomicrobiales bacterium]MBO6913352.1 hypothetical protein [Hyphomicrobiales bacterium]MBO6955852.1 hypothetical protein [Hyphomicrobiales bacterium]